MKWLWSPALPNLRFQERTEDNADSQYFLRAFSCEWPTMIGTKVPLNLSLSQHSARQVSPWMSPELCQSRWGILGGWLDGLSILGLQFSSSLVSELREMWLVSEYKRAPVARASTCLFLAVPDAVSLEELWHHSLCLFTRAWQYKWLIENVNRGCQPGSVHRDLGSHAEWLVPGFHRGTKTDY